MRTYAWLCLTAVISISAARAQDADLTLPPELRTTQQAQPPAAAEHPVKQLKPGKLTKAATQQTTQPLSESPAAVVSKPHNAVDENPLSIGGSWNANNTSENATRATSGLTETNKTHDGESAGIGAKLGLGYKF